MILKNARLRLIQQKDKNVKNIREDFQKPARFGKPGKNFGTRNYKERKTETGNIDKKLEEYKGDTIYN
jgi:hypothetical protein